MSADKVLNEHQANYNKILLSRNQCIIIEVKDIAERQYIEKSNEARWLIRKCKQACRRNLATRGHWAMR